MIGLDDEKLYLLDIKGNKITKKEIIKNEGEGEMKSIN